jgi:phosphoenolpyruvate synthase/pyruvate phosphate dikinase
LEKLTTAIKLVFASIYSPTALAYFKAVNYKVEEEKMAVVIQEVVGNRHDDVFYPVISGVAQSYNYYPYSYMKPEEGFAVMAVGLGRYVVEGEKTFRFSCVHPRLQILTPKDLYKNSQMHFYAINMAVNDFNLLDGEDAALKTLDIDKAEEHGNLNHCASVYNADNDSLSPGIDRPGPRVIDFANILKYDYIPLAKTLEIILDLISESMGTPVEIEFAVDLKRDDKGRTTFYLLQVKPLVKNVFDCEISIDKIDRERLLLYCENGMGNGRVDTITDVVFVDVDKFSNMVTEEIRNEIEKINLQMVKDNRKYVLVGPGRWGTRDKFIGIPVAWSQISNAKVIVEVGLEGFPLDASLGSHFFHNVISMNVGYFSVKHNHLTDFVNWKKLKQMTAFNETKFLKHVRFDKPLEIIMDGKKRVSLIYFPE